MVFFSLYAACSEATPAVDVPCEGGAQACAAEVAELDAPRVVVVLLDGARLEETLGDDVSSLSGGPTAAVMPEVWARMLPTGTRVRGALSTGVPITTEAHTELFTGLRQDLATFPPGVGTRYRSDVPTLFEAVRAADGLAEDQVVMFVNTVLVEDLAWSAWPGLGEPFGATHRFHTDAAGRDVDDPLLLAELRTWLERHDTRLAFVNLHGIDLAGHTGDADAYLDRVREVDAPLVELWEWLQATPPYAGNTTFVVLADHGRHGDAWEQHGDQCGSCRAIPLFVAGPGIAAGAVVDTTITLADIAQTLARQLDVSLPMGRGAPIAALYGEAPAVGRPMGLAVAGARLAVEADGVWLGLERLSDPDALETEAPVLVDGGAGLLACWRELDAADLHWRGRCALDGRDVSPPIDVVSPRWRPALVQEGDTAWAAWIDNPNGWTAEGDARVVIGRLDGGEWTLTEGDPRPSLPTGVTYSRAGGQGTVAFAYSADPERGRDTRGVEVWRTDPWVLFERYAPDEMYMRLESPALRADGAAVAIIAYDEGTTVLLGENGCLSRIDDSGRVLAHIGVAWVGDSLVWARLSAAGTVEVVRSGVGADVVDTGTRVVTALAPTADGFWAAADGVIRWYAWASSR